MLVHAGRNEAWIWFVVVFVFWPAIVFYPLAMAGQRKTRRMQSNATQRRQARYLELARKAEDLQRELERSRKLAGLSSKPARPDGSPQSG